MSPPNPQICTLCGSALQSTAGETPYCQDCRQDVGPDASPLVSVLETADAGLLAIVKSLLDSAEIPYLVQGDAAMSLFPLGVFGRGPFRHGVAAVVRVPSRHAADARALLDRAETTELEEGALSTIDLRPDDDPEDDPEVES